VTCDIHRCARSLSSTDGEAMSRIDRHRRRDAPASPQLVTVRLLVLVIASVIVGVVVGALSWLATRTPWTAALSGLAAAGVSLDRLHRWTGP